MTPIKGTKYLSQLVQMDMLQKDKLNIIKAPTGSGKTYFALTAIPSTVSDPSHKIVYLIDTINGKQQILQNYNARPLYSLWEAEVQGINFDNDMFETDNRIVIITYANFVVFLNRNPDFHKNFEYIICDELHSLIKYQYFENAPNLATVAKSGLERAVRNENTTVIALSATPERVKHEFETPHNELPIDDEEIIRYDTVETIRYTNLEHLLSTLNPSEKGICYIAHIHLMLRLEDIAREKGLKPICIWSISNKNYEMSQEQLNVRETILNTFTVPDEYNFLIINASSETSLKIKSPIDYVIVHSYENDTQIQVRGRVNNDLARLYLPSKDYTAVAVPADFLNRKLFREDKQQLCAILNIRNQSDRLCQWTTIHTLLLHIGYVVFEGRQNNRRFAVIEEPVEVL